MEILKELQMKRASVLMIKVTNFSIAFMKKLD